VNQCRLPPAYAISRDILGERLPCFCPSRHNRQPCDSIFTMSAAFKLVMAAAKSWRRLKGENQLPKVVQGVTFNNGVEVINTPTQSAA